jgi:predicted AlkP superfamily phosphohydrolase/phosphomutase
VPNEFHGAIRINLKGREPNGLIEPGMEYDKFCEELIDKLSSLINVGTGVNAVSEVVRVDRVYQGDQISELPDLIVKWVGDAPIRALHSPYVGTVMGEPPDFRTGAHRPYGFLIASGKEICEGKILERGNIMDIAPTILYLMGQTVSREIDGKVLIDIVDGNF